MLLRASPRKCPTPSFKVLVIMKNNLTEIAYILDRSGSMQPMQEAAVAAFNQFVKSQLDVPGDARLSLIQFDNVYEIPISMREIREVPELTAQTFTPRGSTALLDAIGRTIKETDKRIEATPEARQPGKVIVAIFTDGMENASTEYSAKHIADLIQLYREQKGWDFLFLAANQDAMASGEAMKMDQNLTGNVAFDEKGLRSSSQAMSRKVRAIRMRSAGVMDAQAVADDAKPLEQIVREEEAEADESE